MGDALNEEKFDAVRSIAPQPPATVDPGMMVDIQRLVGRLIAKADKLLGETQNVYIVLCSTYIMYNCREVSILIYTRFIYCRQLHDQPGRVLDAHPEV